MPPLRGKPVLLGFGVLAYAAFLLWYHCPYAGGADSSGYLNSARLLLSGHLTAPLKLPSDLPANLLPRDAFTPLGFSLDPSGRQLTPTYPVGLPLHLAAVGFFLGLGPAATVVGVGSALAWLGLLYLTARELGLRSTGAAALAACAALSPLTLYFALQPMSDLVATDWTLLTVLCALRSKRSRRWAAGAGIAFAMAVLVRPTSLLLLPAALVALHPRPHAWLAFVAGGLPGAGFLACYNRALYGGILTTGYVNVSELFAGHYLLPMLAHYAVWIPVVASPLIVAAVALPWLDLDARRKTVLLLWAGAFPLFYAAYRCTHETWWYLRFLLPALPAFAIAATLTLQRIRWPVIQLAARILPAESAAPEPLEARAGWRLRLALIVGLATAGWFLAWDRHLGVKNVELNERAYRLAGQWVADHVPAGSLVAASQTSGCLLFYANRLSLNWHSLPSPTAASLLARLDARNEPLHAVLFPFEEKPAREKLPGRWELVTRLRQVSIWRRTAPVSALRSPAAP